MNIGIISDIHSNVSALKAVLNEFKSKKIEKAICLGDIIGIGPNPDKCIDLLIENEKMMLAVVKGNHERYLTEGISRDNHSDKHDRPMSNEEIELFKWNHSRLNNVEIKYIESLNNIEKITVENKKIIVTHYPMKSEKLYKDFIYEPKIEEIGELWNKEEADINLFGHTHKEIYIEHEGKCYINPGALGCPGASNIASAGVLKIENGRINYIQLNVSYNKQEEINDIIKFNYPKSKSILRDFYGKNF